MKINHIALFFKDLERIRQFFIDAFDNANYNKFFCIVLI